MSKSIKIAFKNSATANKFLEGALTLENIRGVSITVDDDGPVLVEREASRPEQKALALLRRWQNVFIQVGPPDDTMVKVSAETNSFLIHNEL